MKLSHLFLIFYSAIFLSACNRTATYMVSSDMPEKKAAFSPEPGKCYAKCLIPDQYQVKEIDLAIYTGADNSIKLEKYILTEGTEKTQWTKKRVENCRSSSLDDCLIWCLDTIKVEEESVMYLADTTTTKDYVNETFYKRQLIEKGGFTDWREVVCEKYVSVKFIENLQEALRREGYRVDFRRPTPEMDIITKSALSNFQKAHNLPIGGLNLETLDALGLKY